MDRFRTASFPGGDALVLDLVAGGLHRVNGTAARVIAHLERGEAAAIQALVEEYGISTARAAADVAAVRRALEAESPPRRRDPSVEADGEDFSVQVGGSVVARFERSGAITSAEDAQAALWAAPHAAMISGRPVLHASAVLLRGRAYLFVGESGAGKSTLARSLGEPMADDLSFVAENGASLLVDGEARVREAVKRRPVMIDPGTKSVPIGAVAFIGPRGRVAAEQLPAVEAMRSSLANAFAETADPAVWTLAFSVAERLVRAVPHVQLTVPDGVGALAAATDAIVSALTDR